ncbi:MAG: alanine--tRNA ligase [bacterium]
MDHPTWQAVSDQFVEFFRERGHTVVPSSSLIPSGDPTLLFVNAGMVQFKDTFLGREPRSYRRAASVQKCMRVQGKHNDLENVGPSTRHHTFFLMLGNFSFGDYFKREAIRFAWELVTQRYAIDPDRLYVTIFETDDESDEAWRAVGVPAARIFRMGEKTNFWMMGDTGPCGPNSELHYDWGPDHCSCGRSDCSVSLDNDCTRWLEIWNLVFMQFDQPPDGTRTPLPAPGVDTGMGLERIVSVLQGVNDDYGTDLFMPIMDRLQAILGHSGGEREQHRIAYRVMADHGRAMTFLMADGILPGSEGRSYVLRMIMRRAMRFGRAAGAARPFLADLAGAVIAEMGSVFPELAAHRGLITSAAAAEEDRFTQTLTNGLARLEELLAGLISRGDRIVPGVDVFRLYDTFGFPVEMTRDVARERGMEIDEGGFQRAMAEQRERARAAATFTPSADRRAEALGDLPRTEFLGYRRHSARVTVQALLVNGDRAADAAAGTDVEIVLNRTPFYPEGGGQVGDTGTLQAGRVEVAVRDTQRTAGGVIMHLGSIVRGRLRTGMKVRAQIDEDRRADIMRNHTATHLLHKALREILGEHARQAGSLVAPDRLRFDFTHLSAMTPEQRQAIERRVYEKVLADLPVRATWMAQDEALASGAMALFGEKYGEQVRVITIDDYSRELCGGTHLSRTGQIGLFKITAEEGIAAGVRRIEAVTGRGAYALVAEQERLLQTAADALKTVPGDVPDRVRRLMERLKEAESSRKRTVDQIPTVYEKEHQVGETVLLFKIVGADDTVALRNAADRDRAAYSMQNRPAIAVLASDSTGAIVGAGTTNPSSGVNVGKFIETLVHSLGGSGGGGRADFGQGGLGKNADLTLFKKLTEDSREVQRIYSVARGPNENSRR